MELKQRTCNDRTSDATSILSMMGDDIPFEVVQVNEAKNPEIVK